MDLTGSLRASASDLKSLPDNSLSGFTSSLGNIGAGCYFLARDLPESPSRASSGIPLGALRPVRLYAGYRRSIHRYHDDGYQEDHDE